MTNERFTCKTNNKGITTTFGVVVMLLLLSFYPSCSRDKGEVVTVEFDPENTYTMRTTEISSLISDSGLTRYRVVSPEMLVFDKAADPYYYFPQGIYIEQFDTLFNVQASFEADTAYYWTEKNLSKAIGNIVVVNLDGERFETDTLWWNQETERIYSDAFMHIVEKSGLDLYGIGFSADQNMTNWVIRRPTGSVPVTEEQPADTTQVDDAEVIALPELEDEDSPELPLSADPLLKEIELEPVLLMERDE
ncbi:hypothetical protein M2137_001039 [Parabacteroides sp. PFB2-10]|uniref:LPS export ABC transporter periplasmic protein LptC n=1 Tax=Parabacteroides sp. PFB2-10 TaxID=1742405 RepID=UPI002475A2E9|nr:LPS export ABC transporter periplasmic protein LptC [Parabacteroides sp. PFB2-10]MDH6312269.1 hypothetical protein [Parabacteroides sp. PFB2-10]MDL2244732.1 LPS export ABC transporter periplasmic protein LptC [Parabacteroides sp. OttesenSCG-928-J18]